MSAIDGNLAALRLYEEKQAKEEKRYEAFYEAVRDDIEETMKHYELIAKEHGFEDIDFCEFVKNEF